MEISADARIFVTGHRGLVGSAIVRYLASQGFQNVLTAERQELDLRDQNSVGLWFAQHKPQFVLHAAGTVGGILANATRPADFVYDNLMMHTTVLKAAHETAVDKLLYLGSSCVYPRDCPQPIREEYMLTGPLEKTNQAYAIAKIAGVLSCQAYRAQYGSNFISAMPTNLYGPHDNFDLADAHVLPALIRKFHEAKTTGQSTVRVWGTGQPRREFMYVEDLAAACWFLMENYEDGVPINVGTGEDIRISDLAQLIAEIVYPEAQLEFELTRPDGTPRKLLDVSRLHALGWKHETELRDGIASVYAWFRENVACG